MSSSHQLYFTAQAPFEAACKISLFGQGLHPAGRLHGHSYKMAIRTAQTEISLKQLSKQVNWLAEQLDYQYLNDIIEQPTDENIARWVLNQTDLKNIHKVAIQSTENSGVDLDQNSQAHIWRRYRFEAAHQLPNVPAEHPCGRMHGHGFEIILHVNQDIAKNDMGMNFDVLDTLWAPLNRQLNGKCLNHIDGLQNPTSELLSFWIWQRIKPQCPALSWVTVYETHTSGCHYNGEDYRIWKEFRFESALLHNQQLLGHSYKCRLHLTAPLDEMLGWTVDYGVIKQIFTPVYEKLDHQLLNHSLACEELDFSDVLMLIRQQCAELIPGLQRIDLYESPGLGAQLCLADEGPAIPD